MKTRWRIKGWKMSHGSRTAPRRNALWQHVASKRLSRKPGWLTCRVPSRQRIYHLHCSPPSKSQGPTRGIIRRSLTRRMPCGGGGASSCLQASGEGTRLERPSASGESLAVRSSKNRSWIRQRPPAKLSGLLWKSVLPAYTAPPAQFARILCWLLHQGHILLYTDDTLVVQDAREGVVEEPSVRGQEKEKEAEEIEAEEDHPLHQQRQPRVRNGRGSLELSVG